VIRPDEGFELNIEMAEHAHFYFMPGLLISLTGTPKIIFAYLKKSYSESHPVLFLLCTLANPSAKFGAKSFVFKQGPGFAEAFFVQSLGNGDVWMKRIGYPFAL